MTGCSFTNNVAVGRGDGGGIWCQATNFQLADSLFIANTAQAGGGVSDQSAHSVISNSTFTLTVLNTILSNNKTNTAFQNVGGTIADLGHNISSDATPTWTSGTSLNNTDPLRLPLASNGGPTFTMALRAGSPALNTADCGSAPATDQRGYPRPNGPGCDIGAYEGAGAPRLEIIRENSTTNQLRWLAEASRAYRLDESINLSNWTSLATNTATSNGWIEPRIPANASPRFFQLNVQ